MSRRGATNTAYRMDQEEAAKERWVGLEVLVTFQRLKTAGTPDNGCRVHGRITDARWGFGRLDLYFVPTYGDGGVWVREDIATADLGSTINAKRPRMGRRTP